jgi:hypothetical protein
MGGARVWTLDQFGGGGGGVLLLRGGEGERVASTSRKYLRALWSSLFYCIGVLQVFRGSTIIVLCVY